MTRSRRRPGAPWVYLYTAIAFAWVFALLWNQMAAGRDPALSRKTQVAQVQMVRKIIVTRHVEAKPLTLKPGQKITPAQAAQGYVPAATYVAQASPTAVTNSAPQRNTVTQTGGGQIAPPVQVSQPTSAPVPVAQPVQSAPAPTPAPAPAPVATATS